MLTTVLIIILILILLGAVPSWPYSRGWGYGPSGVVGLILVILLDPASARQDLAVTQRRPVRHGDSRDELTKGGKMLTTILIIILILILLGAFPAWPHSRGWGYGPSGVVGLILVILLILLLLGKI